jgi:hypothetical protein
MRDAILSSTPDLTAELTMDAFFYSSCYCTYIGSRVMAPLDRVVDVR